jgi:putative ABC transport system substrate-binding protein
MPVLDGAAIEYAIGEFARVPGGGLIVQPDVTTTSNRALIMRLAEQYRLPAVYPYQYYVAEGGLASYGIDVVDVYRKAAIYIDRILKGEKPADLPVQAPVKFDLAINTKTAKSLGVEFSPVLLVRADEVIE